MAIVWNKVTWYSKLLAILFFLLVIPVLTFYIGVQYEKTVETLSTTTPIIPTGSNNSVSLNTTPTASEVLATTSAQLSDLATIYPLNWNWYPATSTAIKNLLETNAIFVSNTVSNQTEQMSLPGIVWETITMGDNVENVSSSTFNDAGWQNQLVINDWKIVSETAVGASTITGSIREENGYIQAYTETSKPLDVIYDTSGDVPVWLPVAPYRVQHDVFISNWIPVSTL